jgi:hypothetical protein
MWHVALVALCVVAVLFLAAMFSAVLGVERSLKDRTASGERAAVGSVGVSAAGPVAQAAPGTTSDSGASAGSGAAPAAGGEAVAEARASVPPPKELWVNSEYCWVVVCKNDSFHRHPNLYNVHRIPLGQTDAVAPRPAITKAFSVRCDECRKEYFYSPSDVLRWEMDAPPSFAAHALFG